MTELLRQNCLPYGFVIASGSEAISLSLLGLLHPFGKLRVNKLLS